MKQTLLKKDFIKNENFFANGEKSESLKQTKLMEKEHSKNINMFFDKNIEIVKKDIKTKMDSFEKNTIGIFSILESTKENLEKKTTTLSFKNAAICISDAAYGFFTNSKELFESVQKIYNENKELLADNQDKKLNDMIKSLALIVSMSTQFYKASKKMISKIDLESSNYTEFDENLFSLLDICKTVQSRISSNLSSYKPEKLKIEFINGEKENLFFEQIKQINSLKSNYKVVNISFYKSLKNISSFIRDEKRKNDEEKNKQIVKVNI